VEKHITLAAALNLGMGILGVLVAIFCFVFLVGIGVASGDPVAARILSIVGFVCAFFFMVTSVPQIIGGIALWKRRGWARIVLLVVSVIELLNIPLGTALGVYTIWVLIHDDTKRILHEAGAGQPHSTGPAE
jgi:hypothetical protein